MPVIRAIPIIHCARSFPVSEAGFNQLANHFIFSFRNVGE